jgi:hypothetical protein
LSGQRRITIKEKIPKKGRAMEVGRFRSVSYRAANWIHVGSTTGRGRDGGHKHAILPIKDIYLYPLSKNFKAALTKADFLEA